MANLLLTNDEYRSASNNLSIAKDFFFVLSIALKGAEDNYLMLTTELRDGIALCNNIAYASKVTANGTLLETIRTDLQDDFNYFGNFLYRSDQTL